MINMTTDTINILCCTDDNYAPYYGIMLTSLLENAKGADLHIFVLTERLSRVTEQLYYLMARTYGASLSIITVDDDRLVNCPVRAGDHISIAAYFRLLAPILIPVKVSKLLYLDGDIIVADNILDLWSIDLAGFAIGAVTDESSYLDAPYKRLSYPKTEGYVNSGVLLMNLDYWRTHHVTERLMDCIEKQGDILAFHDQDAINIVLHKELKLLHPRYNLQNGFLQEHHVRHFTPQLQEEIREAIEKPCIIHFGGKGKPWHRREQHPFLSYFHHYKKISLWHDLPLSGEKSLYLDFHFVLRKIKQALGFLPKPYNIPPQKWKR